MLPLLLSLAAARAADTACAGPASSADLVSGIQLAADAYSDLDLAAFRDAVYGMRLVVPCLTEPLTPHDAAEVHRFEGLLGFVERDPDRASRAFAAARAIEPNYRFPESMVPAGNGALADYSAIDPDSGARDRVPLPLEGRILFDGQPAPERPRDFPTVVQLIDPAGGVTDTAYLWPTDAMPPYPPRPVVEVAVQAGDPRAGGSPVSALHTGPDRPLLTGAVFTAVAAAGLYAGAFVVHRRYASDQTDFDRLGTLRTVNNSLVVASGAAAGAALGLGTTAFLVGRF
jgi:hypothetical protein